MSEFNYKPNSIRAKSEQAENGEERKKVEKVVTGVVKTKKKNEMSKFLGSIVSEDAKNVKSYVVMDILLPALKKTIVDIVTDSVNMIVNGGTARGRGAKTSRADYVSYNRYSEPRRIEEPRSSMAYDYRDIVLATRGEAEEVLARLDEVIDTYGTARVADLYDLVGLTGNYTDNKYGWTNLRSADVQRVRDGYLLRLPRAVQL